MSEHTRMPTAARMVSTIGMLAIGWIATGLMEPLLSSNLVYHGMLWLNLFTGVVVGWYIIPRQLGWGLGTAVSAGLTGFAIFALTSVFGQAFAEMIERSLQSRYNALSKAISALFDIMGQIGMSFLNIPTITLLLGLCILVAVIAELIAQRFSR